MWRPVFIQVRRTELPRSARVIMPDELTRLDELHQAWREQAGGVNAGRRCSSRPRFAPSSPYVVRALHERAREFHEK